MVVATRSAGRPAKQAKLEDFDAGDTVTATNADRITPQKRKQSGLSATAKAKTNKKARVSGSGGGSKNDREGDDGQVEEETSSRPPRPSAANAAAIRGNTTVSPSLPIESKRRKPNATSLAPSPPPAERSSSRGTAPKPKSGGRNTGAEAKRAAKKQQKVQEQEQGPEDAGTVGGKNGREGEGKDDLVVINRAPVLQLWGACVARFQLSEREVSWETCLSIGAAIAALCAVSKGKAIGMIEPKDETEEQAAKKEDKKQRARQGAEVYRVLDFPLPVKDGAVLLSGTPKKGNEGQLVAKYGGQEAYERVKAAMEGVLKSWEGDEDELDKKAFSMYEKFRPNVPAGEKGWGRKGELSLAQIESVVRRS